MKKALLLVLPSLAAFALVAVLFSSCRSEKALKGKLIVRLTDGAGGEYATIVEDDGQKYLVVARQIYHPVGKNPRVVLCQTAAIATAYIPAPLDETDTPAIVLYSDDHTIPVKAWRVSDGKVIWEKP